MISEIIVFELKTSSECKKPIMSPVAKLNPLFKHYTLLCHSQKKVLPTYF